MGGTAIRKNLDQTRDALNNQPEGADGEDTIDLRYATAKPNPKGRGFGQAKRLGLSDEMNELISKKVEREEKEAAQLQAQAQAQAAQQQAQAQAQAAQMKMWADHLEMEREERMAEREERKAERDFMKAREERREERQTQMMEALIKGLANKDPQP